MDETTRDLVHMNRPTVQQRHATDCVRACVATILGIPYESAPDVDPVNWHRDLAAFLAPFNLGLLNVTFADPADMPPCYWGLGAVDSSRAGWLHCVVVQGSRIVWDPMRDNRPLSTADLREITYFVTIDPMASPPPPCVFHKLG